MKKLIVAMVLILAMVMILSGCISSESGAGSKRDLSSIAYPITATFDLPEQYIEDDFTVTLHEDRTVTTLRHFGIPANSEWRGGQLHVRTHPGCEDTYADNIGYQIRDDYTSPLQFHIYDDGRATITYMSEFYSGTWR